MSNKKVAGRSRSPYEHLFKPNKFNGSTPFHKNHGNRRYTPPPPQKLSPPRNKAFFFGIINHDASFSSDLSRRRAISWGGGGGGTFDFPWKKKRPFLQDWDGEHEVAWGWLWENIEGLLSSMLGELAGGEGWKDDIEKQVAITFKMGNCRRVKRYDDFFETDFVLIVIM